jgi:DNA-binding transcriptional regulator YiaG
MTHPHTPKPDATLSLITSMVQRMNKALHCFHSIQVKQARHATGLSQRAFAARFGLSPRTVEQWERGIRQPDRAATALLKTIAYAPEVVDAALAASPDMMTLFKEYGQPETGTYDPEDGW